jgi:DNA/RNA-binding domain of Phe-tRNA-synthetase-like protein
VKHDETAERIDAAVFASVPNFARASLRLSGIDVGRGATVRAFLNAMSAKATSAKAISADGTGTEDGWQTPGSLRWREAYAAVGLSAKVVPPPDALRAWAGRPGGVPTTGAVSDLVNAFSLMHDIATAAYDLSDAEGGLWLRPARGHESFEGTNGADSPPLGELILADGADRVIAREWHGTPGPRFMPRSSSTSVQVHLDVLDEHAPALVAELASEMGRLARGYLRCDVATLVLHREAPIVRWPSV